MHAKESVLSTKSKSHLLSSLKISQKDRQREFGRKEGAAKKQTDVIASSDAVVRMCM